MDMTACQEVIHGNTMVTAQALGQQSAPGAPVLTSRYPSLLQFLSSFKRRNKNRGDKTGDLLLGSTRSKTPVRGMSAHKPMRQDVLGA